VVCLSASQANNGTSEYYILFVSEITILRQYMAIETFENPGNTRIAMKECDQKCMAKAHYKHPHNDNAIGKHDFRLTKRSEYFKIDSCHKADIFASSALRREVIAQADCKRTTTYLKDYPYDNGVEQKAHLVYRLRQK